MGLVSKDAVDLGLGRFVALSAWLRLHVLVRLGLCALVIWRLLWALRAVGPLLVVALDHPPRLLMARNAWFRVFVAILRLLRVLRVA